MNGFEPPGRFFGGDLSCGDIAYECSEVVRWLALARLYRLNEVLDSHRAPSNQADFLQSLVEVVSGIDGRIFSRTTGHGNKVRMRG